MSNPYFQGNGEKAIVIYPGQQQGKKITKIPTNVLRAISSQYKWGLKNMDTAREELRRRCNEQK